MTAAGIKAALKRLAGQRPGHTGVVGVDRLVRNWTFRPSRPDHITAVRRIGLARNARPAPASVVLKPACRHPRWAVYFIYAPDGMLTPAHRYTLKRLAASDARLLVVFSSPSPAVPPDLVATADALYWKALSGFDFSGYAIALHALAAASPGCDILVMNDSVLGPFRDLDQLWAEMAWDVTGFTASSSVENHIQSYAFMLRGWTAAKMRDLDRIFPRLTCFDHYEEVVLCQETRFARVAARTMTVGALWYADQDRCLDPSVYAAPALAAHGFPFVKKSLLTKHAGVHDVDTVARLLA